MAVEKAKAELKTKVDELYSLDYEDVVRTLPPHCTTYFCECVCVVCAYLLVCKCVCLCVCVCVCVQTRAILHAMHVMAYRSEATPRSALSTSRHPRYASLLLTHIYAHQQTHTHTHTHMHAHTHTHTHTHTPTHTQHTHTPPYRYLIISLMFMNPPPLPLVAGLRLVHRGHPQHR
jgi:hypothetical protein